MSEELDSLSKAARYDIIMSDLETSFRLWKEQYLKFKDVGDDTLMNYCEGHLHAIKATCFYSRKDECPCNRCEAERTNLFQPLQETL